MIFALLGGIVSSFLILTGNAVLALLAGIIINICLTILGLTASSSILIILFGFLGASGSINPEASIGAILGFFCSSPLTNGYRTLNPELTNDIDFIEGGNSLRDAKVEVETMCFFSAFTLPLAIIAFLSGSNQFFIEHMKGLNIFLISISSIIAIGSWVWYFSILPNKHKATWLLNLVLSILFSIGFAFFLKDTQFSSLSVILPILILNLPLPNPRKRKKRAIKFDKVYTNSVTTDNLSNATIASVISGSLIMNSNSILMHIFTHNDDQFVSDPYSKRLHTTHIAVGKAIHTHLQFFSWVLLGSNRMGEMQAISDILDAWEINTFTLPILFGLVLFIKLVIIAPNIEGLLEMIHNFSIPPFWGNSILLVLSSFSLFLLFDDPLIGFLIMVSIVIITFFKGLVPRELHSFSLVPLLIAAFL